MSWTFLVGLVCVLGLALLAAILRRAELARMRVSIRERERAVRQGSAKAQLQHPVVDLSRCLGCATCVAVCPEENVLDIVHGQAVVVNGARCMGIAACERECPVGAITVTLADLDTRRDVPVLDPSLEAAGAPGLFLAGEVTAHALIKTAIEHGTAVAAEVAARVKRNGRNGVLDLCVVGAGPAGLACSLEARRHGLDFVTLEQETGVGGTVAKYPRRKLVMTEPVDLPLHGRLKKRTYTKEELIELWQRIAEEHALPIEGSRTVEEMERDDDGHFVVRCHDQVYRARHVCLALGRRGIPNKLGIPGEELPHVAYSLLDANSYAGRRILVVGGGDSAVEAAVGLAAQPGTQVVLAYRKEAFFRIRGRNQRQIEESSVEVLFKTEVREIRQGSVELTAGRVLPIDDVFIMAGGKPPFPLLERSGVSFDPALRAPPPVVLEQGTGLVHALAIAFGFTLAALLWALLNSDYYALPAVDRPVHDKHAVLRPGRGAGLGLGIAAAGLILVNLAYLLRRAQRVRWGSLRGWMTSHVATGVLAVLCALLHGGMAPGDTVGGHAFWALLALLLTGAIGRYFYAWVPRAANGRELELAEARAELERMPGRASEVVALIERRQWRSSFFARVIALFRGQRELHRMLKDMPPETRSAARRAHRAALMASHYEDLRGLLAAWRYLHRWVAALMVLLVLVHVANALLYAGGGGAAGGGGMP